MNLEEFRSSFERQKPRRALTFVWGPSRAFLLLIFLFLFLSFALSFTPVSEFVYGVIYEHPTLSFEGLKNPSYGEMVRFLENDLTDLNEWTHSYNCYNFSVDLIKAAARAGFHSAYVVIPYNLSVAHSVVAFEPYDQDTIYYIEPQSDEFLIDPDVLYIQWF
jgi:hypothetical protein